MPAGRDLPKRHRTRQTLRLVDFDVLSRQLTALDPNWRERKKVAGPLHRDAAIALREGTQPAGEQPGQH